MPKTERSFDPVQTTPFDFTIKVKAHLWKFINSTVFMIFPNQIKKPRIFMLVLFGAKLSKTVNISRTAKIEHPWNLQMGHLSSLGDYSWVYCLDKITIGEKCCVGRDVYLLTGSHDIADENFNLVTKPIEIKDGCWIATGAYVLPGITLGEYTVVAAKSLVVNSTEPYSVVAGNPAKFIKKREIIK
jgi:putative colanic acid biosynthesis acetyltransferase WcaF